MKKIIILFSFLFCDFVFANTITIDWRVDNQSYAQTSCNTDDELILPDAPTKYGYSFSNWDFEYTRLEYIETDSNSYIILDGYATNDTSFDMIVTRKCVGVGKGLYGAASIKSWPLGSGIEISNNPNAVYLLNGAERNVSGAFSNELEVHIVQNKNVYTFTDINGTRTYTQPGGNFQTTHNIMMGAIMAYGYYNFRICPSVWKYFNVSNMVDENGNVLPDVNLIPVRRNSDNTIGMYDTVTDTFVNKRGSGSFTAGPDIPHSCTKYTLNPNNNSATVTAIFTPNQHTCSAGYYLPANTDGCVICPANSYCSGGTYTFNANVAQGIMSCAAGLFAPAGMWESAQCGRILHVGDEILYLRATKKTTPSLHIDIDRDGTTNYFGNMTTLDVPMTNGTQRKLKINYDGQTYSVYDDTITLP